MTRDEIVRGLYAEAERYVAAAKQQDRMAEWSGSDAAAIRSRERAMLFLEAAALIEAAAASNTGG